MQVNIHHLLSEIGPCLSSRLAARLQDVGVSAVAARKRIQRAVRSVRKLEGIRFAHNEQFVYLEHQFRSPEFVDALLSAFDESGPSYAMAIHSIAARGGIIPVEHFNTISGSPILLRNHIPSNRILQKLISLQILSEMPDSPIGPYIELVARNRFHVEPLARIRARLLTENVLLLALRDWARRKIQFPIYCCS